MPVRIIPKDNQFPGGFNGGAILERRPIMPEAGKGHLTPYSNLFYWAYAWSEEGSTIGLHPHKGFEIMSFVVKGSIEHYDSQLQSWRLLKAGDAQIIRSGNGISHSERLHPNSALFQIWVDPDLRQSFGQRASYDDYASEDFPVMMQHGIETKVYCGENAPLCMEAEGISVAELRIPTGQYGYPIHTEQILSAFLIEGQLTINDQSMEAGDFVRIQGEEKANIDVSAASRLFVIQSPLRPSYRTYAERFA
ncbi:MAG: pirin family protein [Bacteroidota bacterium]